MSTFQHYPALDTATEAALRASIERYGVLVAVVKDQHGRILDGHHRARIADELSVSYETVVYTVSGDDEARDIERTLNEDRRHLTAAQRREIEVALREAGHSLRAIGGALGVSKSQVERDLSSVPAGTVPKRVIGLDGRSRPSKRTRSSGRTRSSSAAPTTARQKQLANAAKRRVEKIVGTCQGLTHTELLNLELAGSVSTSDEINDWASTFSNGELALKRLRLRLKEIGRSGQGEGA